MGDHDPPPFGYTFDDFLGPADSSNFAHVGQSLLSDHENQSLTDFFQNGPFNEVPDSGAFMGATDLKDGLFDYNNWSEYIAPAVVHRVETIPDQAHLQHNFHNDHSFAPPLHPNQFENTQDDLDAASTLFHNSQSSYPIATNQNYLPIPAPSRDHRSSGTLQSAHNIRPMVPFSHGLINEQLAALLPNLSEDGTLDAHVAARVVSSDAQQRHDAEFGYIEQKPNFRRSYTFGTDHSFSNPSGFSAPARQGLDDTNSRYPKQAPGPGQNLLLRMLTGEDKSSHSPNETTQFPLAITLETSDAEQSEAPTTSEDEDDRPAKKRKKNKSRVSKESPHKIARTSKGRKASLIEESGKKRRASAATQRLQRENLTEEQKRNNHILSEQKRRNLIKRGFDDLHHLVPEIRNGGLSKSSVLLEAGNFLEKLIQENASYTHLAGGILSS